MTLDEPGEAGRVWDSMRSYYDIDVTKFDSVAELKRYLEDIISQDEKLSNLGADGKSKLISEAIKEWESKLEIEELEEISPEEAERVSREKREREARKPLRIEALPAVALPERAPLEKPPTEIPSGEVYPYDTPDKAMSEKIKALSDVVEQRTKVSPVAEAARGAFDTVRTAARNVADWVRDRVSTFLKWMGFGR